MTVGHHKPRRAYSEADKASALTALKANGGNISATAADTGIPRATLTKWRDGLGVNADVSVKCQQKEEELGSIFEKVCRTYLSRALDAQAVADSRGKDAVIAAATALDKLRLLRGEPSVITQHDERRTISAAILADPAACDAVTEALERFTTRTALPRQLRAPLLPGEVDMPEAFELIEQVPA